MKRREFLKTAGLCGLSLLMPSIFLKRNGHAALLDSIECVPPPIIPQIISIFLYGGPSELAGNLTNMEEIVANSQNGYPFSLDPNNANNDITANNFWGAAGGAIMEQLLADGDMSIYRTINRIKYDSKDHRSSVTQNLLGNLDMTGPGIATTLAAILATFNPFGRPIEELLLPFVSFEGDSKVFSLGDLDIPLALRPMTLDSDFRNPYQRSKNRDLDKSDDNTNDTIIEELARTIASLSGDRHQKVNDAFLKRAELDDFVATLFNSDMVDASLPIDPATGNPIEYPDNNFGRRLKAAVALAVNNPDTVFISLGSGGLGGWDDHSGALEGYPSRIQGLFEALEVAAKHMNLMNATNIVINVFGDFGRNVNLNDSMGWDHGNNQNLYTLGGAAIPGRSLGKLVGKTQHIGTPFRNRQFTSPTDDSYQCEPFSIASTIFRYFGVQNPERLTGEPPIDESSAVPTELIS